MHILRITFTRWIVIKVDALVLELVIPISFAVTTWEISHFTRAPHRALNPKVSLIFHLLVAIIVIMDQIGMFTTFFISFEGRLELFDLLALLDLLLLERLALQLMLVTAAWGLAWPLRIELFVLAHCCDGSWRHLKWLSFLLLAISDFLLCAEVIITKGELDSHFALRFADALPAFMRKWIRLHRFHGLDRIIFLHVLKSNWVFRGNFWFGYLLAILYLKNIIIISPTFSSLKLKYNYRVK